MGELPGVSCVVLGKYWEVFQGFRQTAEQHLSHCPKVFVRDGNEIEDPPYPNWKVVQGPEQFSMAGNANLGWRACNPADDILYLSDDVRFQTCSPLEGLRMAAYSADDIGIVSPVIMGSACNKLQTDRFLTHITESKETLAFICVFIKRRLIDKIGMLDEAFDQYGYDDVDYCRRARQAGFRLVVTPGVRIAHWDDAHATFKRNPVESWSLAKNKATYERKWGDLKT